MATTYDDIFKAMADPHRREILSSLTHGPMVAGELARQVQLAPNALSFHLKWLRSAGLVSMRREGRFLRYAANRAAVTDWQAHVTQSFASKPGDTLHPFPPMPVQSTRTARGIPLMFDETDDMPVTTPTPSVAVEESDTLPTELL